MSNFQVRALTLIAGHGFVLSKAVELTATNQLSLTQGWSVIAILLPVLGIMFGYSALQEVDHERQFRMKEGLSLWCATFIGLGLMAFAFTLPD